jgi:hypothetical protein
VATKKSQVPIVQDKEDRVDTAEDKFLDKVLMGIVVFVLGWLALGVLMAVGGLFGIWK